MQSNIATKSNTTRCQPGDCKADGFDVTAAKTVGLSPETLLNIKLTSRKKAACTSCASQCTVSIFQCQAIGTYGCQDGGWAGPKFLS